MDANIFPHENPFFEDEDDDTFKLHQEYKVEIADLKRQVEHHKQLSEQLQQIALEESGVAKRKYTIKQDTAKLREFIKDNINNEKYIADLLKGVGLSDAKASNIPRSLIKGYLEFRFRQNTQQYKSSQEIKENV